MSRLQDLRLVLQALDSVLGHAVRLQGECVVKNAQPVAKGVREAAEAAFKVSPSQFRRTTSSPQTDGLADKMVMLAENVAEFSKASGFSLSYNPPPSSSKATNILHPYDHDLTHALRTTLHELEERRRKRTEEEEDDFELTLNPDLTALELLQKVDLFDRAAVEKAAFVRTRKRTVKKKEEEEVVVEPTRVMNMDEDVEMGEKKLSSRSSEKRVPSSRLGRIASFGSLGVGLGLGTVAEASRRLFGGGSEASVLLSEANAERIVATLCRVRGAALKIGQILSIQDESLVGPEVGKIFERVRESADYMPIWQMEKVMVTELCPDWRETHFTSFEDKPFAAASIGQVHAGVLKSGLEVAVKIQYPGVAKGIDSDINNILGMLSVAKILPESLFIDKIIDHMKIELAQECDYIRESECCTRMGELLKGEDDLYVPTVVPEVSTKQIFTTEMIQGLTIDQCADLSQETRDHITLTIMNLLFRELFIHRYMQTDPNWANFLYNPKNHKLGLLDFGATREFRPFFVNNYFEIIDGASEGDRDRILKYSRIVGFLTGYESQTMLDAHVESVMILGQCFREDRPFNFGKAKTTARMQGLVPVMLKERLVPPPPEVYSLHRKMSGLFLLATKLQAEVNAYPLWRKIREDFKVHKMPETEEKMI